MDEFNFYKYVDEKSILIITPKNKLIRVKCPFAITNKFGQVLQVDLVKEINNVSFYKINGKFYSYTGYIIINSCH